MDRSEALKRFAGLFEEAADIMNELAETEANNDPLDNFREFASSARITIDGSQALNALRSQLGDPDIPDEVQSDLDNMYDEHGKPREDVEVKFKSMDMTKRR